MSHQIHIHASVLPTKQLSVLRLSGPVAHAEAFYLGGGTALALHLGHRRSIDFDWFRPAAIARPEELALRLRAAEPKTVIESTARDTLHVYIDGVECSFFTYTYPLMRQPLVWSEIPCALASIEDIACMKLVAIAQRGERKDFVDVFAIAKSGVELEAMLQLAREKFGMKDIGHILAALAYFDDAEREPMPDMLWRVEWSEMRSSLQEWVKRCA